jgi:hypothetical protein
LWKPNRCKASCWYVCSRHHWKMQQQGCSLTHWHFLLKQELCEFFCKSLALSRVAANSFIIYLIFVQLIQVRECKQVNVDETKL